MPIFTYKAIDSSGRSITGELDAADRRSVVQRLTASGIRPTSIAQSDRAAVTDDSESETVDFFASERKVHNRRFFRMSKQQQALNFFKRLLALISAGMSLGDATRLMSIRLNDPQLKALCGNIWKLLSEGHTLAGALATQDKMFTPAQIHLIEAGEASGNLAPVIGRLVDHMEETRAVKNRMIAGLSYPMFIVFIAFGVIGVVVTFLMPKIQAIVDQMGGEVFFLAKWLLAASDVSLKFGPFVALALIFLIYALFRWRKTPSGRKATDLWILRAKFIGPIYLYANIYQTSNLLGTLLGSGVNTTEALRLVERTINNVILRAKFAAARKQIQEGVSMATAIQRVHYMPDLAMDILTVGENTGDIVTSLNDVNSVYREELTKKLDILTKATAGIALGVAFVIVAVIAFSVAFSVISVSQSILK